MNTPLESKALALSESRMLGRLSTRLTIALLTTVLGCGTGSPADTQGEVSSGTDTPGTTKDDAAEDESGAPGDGTHGEAEGECEPSEQSIRETIIEPACATMECHDASAAGGLDLTVPDLATSMAGTLSGTCDGEVLLVAGDPMSSFFFDKLQAEPACGVSMPVGQMLTSTEIACIAEWIEQTTSSCETCGEETCVDLDASPLHCGACGSPCPDGIACIEGRCACPVGTEQCGGDCIDTNSDPAHCGGCERPCGDGLFCFEGGCADDCGSLTECTGACVDTETNPLHCGGCEAACADAEVCLGGSCGCDAPPTSYASDVEPFIVAECATNGCHRPMGPNPGSEGLNLATGAGYAALVGVPAVQCADRLLVDPGSPASSYLNDKVLGINLCHGTVMPKSGPGLTATQLQTLSDWICSGAAP